MILLAAALVTATPASAAVPEPLGEPHCLRLYQEYDFGAVRYVSRDTCSAELYVNGEQVWPPTTTSAAPDKCIELFYVADYQWTYLCVEPSDTSCAVYIKHVRGVTETRDCIGVAAAATAGASGNCIAQIHNPDYMWTRVCYDADDASCVIYLEHQRGNAVTRDCYGAARAAAAGPCVPVTGNLEETYLCVDARDVRCPVYTVGPTGTHCIAGVPALGPSDKPSVQLGCIPTSGGLDYHTYLCVDASDTRCPVYTTGDTGTTCVGLKPQQARCLDRYHRTDIGPVTYESRSSCEHQVYVFDKPLLG